MTTIFDIGDTVKLTFTFTDETGALIDPDTVLVTLTDRDHAAVTYTYGTDAELTRDSVGVFILRVLASAPAGRYFWHGVGATDELSQAAQSSYYVKPLPS